MEVNSVNRIAGTTAAAEAVTSQNRFQTTPEMAEAVTAINSAKLFGENNELTFAMDRDSRRMVVRLVDRTTRQVIRQIPPQYLLDLAKNMQASSAQ